VLISFTSSPNVKLPTAAAAGSSSAKVLCGTGVVARWLIFQAKRMENAMSDNSEMWRTELSPEQRALAWKALFLDGLGPQSRASQDCYVSLCQAPSSYDAVIQRDLGRTLPQEALFREKSGKGQSALFRLLHALALHLWDIGYVQSLNFIIATLIGVFPDDEALVFHCAQALLFRYSLADFYRPHFPKLGVTAWQFDRIVEGFLPRVHSGLQRHGITAEYYAMQWFLTLFASDLSQPIVRRIWDRFLLAGWHVIVQVGLALLYDVQETLLAFDGCEVLTFLKRFTHKQQYEAERLLDIASGFEVTHQMLSQLEVSYAANGVEDVELLVWKDLNIGHTSWEVAKRTEVKTLPNPGDLGAEDFSSSTQVLSCSGGARPGRSNGQGTMLPFLVHNLDTGETTVMEDEWMQYKQDRLADGGEAFHQRGPQQCGQESEASRGGSGSFWLIGQQHQALRKLGKV
jgi:hypothetical protein